MSDDTNPFLSSNIINPPVETSLNTPIDLEQTAAPSMKKLLKTPSTQKTPVIPSKSLSSGAMIGIISVCIALPLIGIIVYVILTIQHKNPTYTPTKLPDRPSGNYIPSGGKKPENLPSSRIFNKVYEINAPSGVTNFGYRTFAHDTGWVVVCSTSSLYGSTSGHNLYFYKPSEYSSAYQTLSFFENASNSSRYGTGATDNDYGGRFVIVDGCFAPSITSASEQVYYLFLSIGVAVTFPDDKSVKLNPSAPDPTNYCATEVHIFTYDTGAVNPQWTHQYNANWPLQHPLVKLKRFWNPQLPYLRAFGQRLKCIVSPKGRHELYLSATASETLDNRNSSATLGLGGVVFQQLLLNNSAPPALDQNMVALTDIRLFYINNAADRGVRIGGNPDNSVVPSYDKLGMGPMDYLHDFGYDFDVSTDLCSIGNPGIMEFTALDSSQETASPQGYVQSYTRTDKLWVQNNGGADCVPDLNGKPPIYGCEGLRYNYCQNIKNIPNFSHGRSLGAGVKQYLSKFMLTCLGGGMKNELAAWYVFNIPQNANTTTFDLTPVKIPLTLGKESVIPVSGYSKNIPDCGTSLPTDNTDTILPVESLSGYRVRHNALVTSENRLLLGVYNGTKGGNAIAYVDPWVDTSTAFAKIQTVQLFGDATQKHFQNSNNSSVPKVDSYGYGQFMGAWDSIADGVYGVPVVFFLVNDPNYNSAAGRVMIYYKLAAT